MGQRGSAVDGRDGIVFSLLLPTRQRPGNMVRLYESVMGTADKPETVEIVCYIDNDDQSYDALECPRLVKIRGPRTFDGKVNLSEMWNACWRAARGDYFMHAGDDLVFKSPHWDTLIKEAIDARPGKICFAWGNDFQPDSQRNVFGTHGFIHRNWTDVVGRFVPPYFVSDYNDTWLNDVGEALHVRTYVHNVWTEHMHYSLGKAEVDENTKERLERHNQDNPEKIYQDKAEERQAEIEKLREFINANV